MPMKYKAQMPIFYNAYGAISMEEVLKFVKFVKKLRVILIVIDKIEGPQRKILKKDGYALTAPKEFTKL